MPPSSSSILGDESRLAALRAAGLLDSISEEPFDRTTRLVTRLLDVPIALLTLVTPDRQVFKSCIGLPEPWATRRETPLAYSLCQHVVTAGEPLVLEDVREDSQLRHSRAVSDLKVIAYAGVPIITAAGHRLGSLAAADVRPRKWTGGEIEVLRDLAGFVVDQADARLAAHERAEELAELHRREQALMALMDHAPDLIARFDRELRHLYVNPVAEEITGIPVEHFLGRTLQESGIPHPDAATWADCIRRAFDTGEEQRLDSDVQLPDGRRVWLQSRFAPERAPDGHVASVLAITRDITEQKRAESDVRTSERLFRSLIEHSQDVITLFDADGTILYESPSLPRVLGWKPEEMVGREVFEFLHPDDRQAVRETFRELARSPEATMRTELRFRHAEGHWEVLAAVGSNHLDDPSVRAIVANSRCVTQQREAERRIRESEERFRQLAEHIPQAFWLSTVAGENLYISPAFEQIWGRSVSEVLADPGVIYRDVHPEDQERAYAGFALMREREIDGIEYRIVRPDGTVRWVSTSGFPVRSGDGAVVRIAGITEDITESKEAREALRQQTEILQTIVDNVPVMLTFFDAQGEFQWVNRAWEQVLGWSLAEARSRDLLSEFYPDPAVRAQVLDAMQRAEPGWKTFQTRTRSGKVIWTSWANVRLSDGTRIGIGQDVTEQRNLEQRFREAQKMEAVGRLAGGVAHDFNNLLTVIVGHTSLLLAAPPEDEAVHSSLAEIRKAAERAASLTRQLLAFGRKQILETRVMDLNEAVRDASGMLRRLVRADIALETELDSELGRVRADPNQVHQVLLNLVLNASDAMPREGGTITVATRNRTITEANRGDHYFLKPGHYVTLSVTDTGSGIPAEILPHIFEPFFTTKEVGQGTGLGLSTVYGIMKQSEGYVLVESEPGKGSTFEVLLPRVTADPQENGAGVARTEAPGGRETVLLVEDEPQVRVLARRVLERSGYHVVEAQDGEEALRLLGERRLRPDLLITDVIMPHMGGRVLAKRLRATNPSLRVIFMSGYADDALTEDGSLEMGSAFIQKPFSPDALARAVRAALEADH